MTPTDIRQTILEERIYELETKLDIIKSHQLKKDTKLLKCVISCLKHRLAEMERGSEDETI